MIIDAIVAILVTLFTGSLALMPAWDLPGSMASFGSGVGSAIAAANGIFPVVTMGICLAVLLGAQLFAAAFGLVVFLYDRIPFKAT